MKTTLIILLFLAIATLVSSVLFLKKKKKKSVKSDPTPTAVFPYRVNSPTRTIELPNKLREISDLSFDPAANALWAIADDRGVLFRIGLSEATTIDAFPFNEDGDFEGVELVGSTIYVMESNGRVIRLEDPTSANPRQASYNNPSLEHDDLEAFMYDPKRQRLIIGVKTPAKGNGKARPFYALDPATMKLDETPIFEISLEGIQAFLRKNGLESEQYEDWFKKSADVPSPSAVAIHPVTGNYYVLASDGKALLVTTPNGGILQVVSLDKAVHAQPEGIAFDGQGTMYISNEARGGVAKLYAYKPE